MTAMHAWPVQLAPTMILAGKLVSHAQLATPSTTPPTLANLHHHHHHQQVQLQVQLQVGQHHQVAQQQQQQQAQQEGHQQAVHQAMVTAHRRNSGLAPNAYTATYLNIGTTTIVHARTAQVALTTM